MQNRWQYQITARDDEISHNLPLDRVKKENQFMFIMKTSSIRKEAYQQECKEPPEIDQEFCLLYWQVLFKKHFIEVTQVISEQKNH